MPAEIYWDEKIIKTFEFITVIDTKCFFESSLNWSNEWAQI